MSKRTDILKLPKSIKRLILLGDPHGHLNILKYVYDLENNPETFFISMGDNIGYQNGEQSSELIEFLYEKKIPSVYGNHEEWLRIDGELFLPSGTSLTFSAFDWCKVLPLRIKIETEIAPHLYLTVQHSLYNDGDWDWLSDKNLKDFFREVPGNVILTGHSHQPKIHILGSIGNLKDVAHTLTLEGQSSSLDLNNPIKIKSHIKYVLDSGSLSRATTPFKNHGSYGVVDLVQQTLGIKLFDKATIND